MPQEENPNPREQIVPFQKTADTKPGRPVTLDNERKQLICSLVAAGYSRRRAALQIGCSPSTVTRHLQSDPAFAEQLRTSRMHNELASLGHLRQAASKSWRAAAWLLERQHPQQYGRRNPDIITREEFRETMTELAVVLDEEIRDSQDRERVRLRIKKLIGAKTPEEKTEA